MARVATTRHYISEICLATRDRTVMTINVSSQYVYIQYVSLAVCTETFRFGTFTQVATLLPSNVI